MLNTAGFRAPAEDLGEAMSRTDNPSPIASAAVFRIVPNHSVCKLRDHARMQKLVQEISKSHDDIADVKAQYDA